MKKVIIFSLFLSVFQFGLFAQIPTFQWASNMGSSFDEQGTDVTVDASGNVYTTGNFSGTADFDPGAATYTLTSLGNTDIFITKFDALGNFIWAKQIGGSFQDDASKIVVDATGDVYVTGTFSSTACDFDPGPSTYTLSPFGNRDAFILKLSTAGSFLWAYKIGGTSIDLGNSIKLDATGNMYLCGSFSGTADFDPGAGTFNLTSSGGTDIFIMKLNSSGTLIWADRAGGTGNDNPLTLFVEAGGNVVVGGRFSSFSCDFDPGPSTFILNSSGTYSAFVLKLNQLGNFIWAKSFNSINYVVVNSLTEDALGNIYFTGHFANMVDFDPGPGTYTFSAASSFSDIYIDKLDASGNFVWAVQYASAATAYEDGNSIVANANNEIYLTGRFSGTIDFDPGPAIVNLNSQSGSPDIFILKINSSAGFIAAVNFGGLNIDAGNGLFLDGPDKVLTTGVFSGTGDFDPGIGTYSLTSAGNDDAFVLKLDFTCNAPSAPTNITPVANLTLCSNSSATLNASGSGIISWYSSPTSTTALATGTVYVTPNLITGTYTYYAEDLTCTTSATRTAFNVTVNPLPNVTISTSSSLICVGQSATLTAGNATTYSWNFGPATSTVSVNPTNTTSYTVTGIGNNGCSNTAIYTQLVSLCTGLVNAVIENLQDISVYPNPTNSHVTISVMNHEISLVEIYNVAGQLLSKYSGQKTSDYVLDLTDFKNQVIIVKTKDETGAVYVRRCIVGG